MINILLPACSGESKIGGLLHRIQDARERPDHSCDPVLVVLDGSTARRQSIIVVCPQSMPNELMDHGVNRCQGQVMLTGLRRVFPFVQDDVLVRMDADCTDNLIAGGAK